MPGRWAKAEAARWALWLCLGALLRARALPPTVGDVDGVNFARALARFDPLRQAPHFPGYGVYVGFIRLARGLGLAEVAALAGPGLVVSLLGALVLALAVRRGALGAPPPRAARQAELALVLCLLLPGAVLFGGWPTSDGLGLGLLFAALGLAGHTLVHSNTSVRAACATSAAVLAGLLLGVRLSWWPVVLIPAAALTLRPGLARRWGLLTAAVAGLAVMGPLLLVLSPTAAVEGLLGFGQGHLSGWGGAAEGLVHLPARALAMVLGMSALLGTWSPGAEVAAALLSAAGLLALWFTRGAPPTEARRGPLNLAALSAAGYGVWVLVAQNVEKPRHLLPLLPLCALLAASRLAGPRIPAWAVAGALVLIAAPRATAQARLAPAPALVQYVLQNYRPTGLQVFAGEEARVFEHLAPAYRVWRPASAEVLEVSAEQAAHSGAVVLVTSGTPGVAQLRGRLTEVTRTRAPRPVRAHDSELVLYRYTGAPDRNMHANR